MNMVKVASSNIEAVGWKPNTEGSALGVLRVEFGNGAVYEYADCPAHHFEAMVTADGGSVGRYFHERIKGQYPTTKVN